MMAVPAEAFRADVLYVDFPQEDVAFRHVRTPEGRRLYRRFYGEAEETEIEVGNALFFEATCYGHETTAEVYAQAGVAPGPSPR